MLNDSSEPVELVHRDPFILGGCSLGQGSFFMLLTNLYPWLGLTKAKRVQQM